MAGGADLADLTPMRQQQYQQIKNSIKTVSFFSVWAIFTKCSRTTPVRVAGTGTDADDAGPQQENPEERVPDVRRAKSCQRSLYCAADCQRYKVAICEQTEDPALARVLSHGTWFRVVTPGDAD
jgi:DNA mismatch repair protein MutS